MLAILSEKNDRKMVIQYSQMVNILFQIEEGDGILKYKQQWIMQKFISSVKKQGILFFTVRTF